MSIYNLRHVPQALNCPSLLTPEIICITAIPHKTRNCKSRRLLGEENDAALDCVVEILMTASSYPSSCDHPLCFFLSSMKFAFELSLFIFVHILQEPPQYSESISSNNTISIYNIRMFILIHCRSCVEPR
jgi:hypothetical protein